MSLTAYENKQAGGMTIDLAPVMIHLPVIKGGPKSVDEQLSDFCREFVGKGVLYRRGTHHEWEPTDGSDAT
jgi:hypothetical protein